MPAPAKYTEVMSVIKRRIREGDYLLDNIPGERKIAEETGVSYMTARRAVQELLDEEVLIRQPSGSLDVHPGYSRRAKPAEQFVHWDDKTVLEAVDQAKGTLIIPYGPIIPPRLLEPFRANKVVILDGDFTNDGLPSIRFFSERCIERVMDHLYKLGHRHVDCVNTQNRNPEIDRRIGIWERWLRRRGIKGDLHDDPAPVFTDPTIVAHRLMSRLLDKEQTQATAFIATTCPAAIGSIRACWEREICVGQDISIATVNIEPPAEFFCPSITGLNTPDLTDVLGRCFDWFSSRATTWRGPRLMEPKDSVLFEGESTGKSKQMVLT
jgi:DNA-binding transcriptional regulator YhcF (GntR family)